MQTHKLTLLFLLFSTGFLFSQTFTQSDSLNFNQQYIEESKLLEEVIRLDPLNSEAHWRLARSLYFHCEKSLTNKKERLNWLNQSMERITPWYTPELSATPEEEQSQAKLIYWFAVISSAQADAKGLKASVNNIPKLFTYCDQSINLDPNLSEPYYLKSQLNYELPFFMGGDLFIAGEQAAISIELAPENILYLVDAAWVFYKRNLSETKKNEKANDLSIKLKENYTQADRSISKRLVTKAVQLYKAQSTHSRDDNKGFAKSAKLLKKLN